jgi:HAD superfamily hydrolase (TIGR01549 family)
MPDKTHCDEYKCVYVRGFEVMKLEGITGLIFDLGGTLFKPVSDMCGLTRDFLNNAGLGERSDFSDVDILAATKEPDEWLTSYMIENDVDRHWKPELEHWIEYDRRLLAALGVKDREDVVQNYQKEWDNFHEEASHELIEGCKEGLEELKRRGFKLGIASNRFTDPTHPLEYAGIHHLFDAVEYTNVPRYRKPSPYMLVKVAEAFGTNPHRCAYVGNIVEYDVVSATRAGMIPILLTWCNPQEEEKISSDTVVIEHIKDLMEIL